MQDRETVALALAKNAALAVNMHPVSRRLSARWRISCLNLSKGQKAWEQVLPGQPLVGGILLDREGKEDGPHPELPGVQVGLYVVRITGASLSGNKASGVSRVIGSRPSSPCRTSSRMIEPAVMA